MHVNLVYQSSLHPKKAILTTFSGQPPHFLGKMQKTRTNNLHHWEVVSVADFLSLLEGVQHIQKWSNNLVNTVAIKQTLYLARPPKVNIDLWENIFNSGC